MYEAMVAVGANVPRQEGAVATLVTTCPERRAEGIAGWPTEQIEQTLNASGEQRRALDSLRTALDQAFDRTQASCSTALPQSSLERLEVLRKRIETLRAAVRAVRAPLSDLYGSLSDAQKARLNAADREGIVDAMRACTADTGGVMQSAAGQLHQSVQPTADQRAGLEILVGTFGHVAEILKASCPAETPLTAVGRIDAAEKRLRVMLYAISTMRGPLNRFYASLNEEQKTRFGAGTTSPQPGSRRRADMRPHG